jgi:phosphohistidine phosphatase
MDAETNPEIRNALMARSSSSDSVQFLYLVQHGEAKPKTEDPERPLTDQGRRTIEKVAEWAAKAGIRVDQIRHGEKLRARETAAIFAEKMPPNEGMASLPQIGPMDDPRPLAEVLGNYTGAIMIVGHLPFLNRLAGLLLTGDSRQEVIRFCNGGIVGLVRDEGRWTLGCFIPPQWAG